MIEILRRAAAAAASIACLIVVTALPGHAVEVPTAPSMSPTAATCPMLDALCDVVEEATDAVTGAVGEALSVDQSLSPADFNPLGGLGGIVADAAATAFSNRVRTLLPTSL